MSLKIDGPSTVFVVAQATVRKFLIKITEFDKSKTWGKEHNSSQPIKSSQSSHNLSILDRVRLNNATGIINHLNINSLKNKFEMLRQPVQNKLNIFLVSETKVDLSFPSSQFAIEGFSVPFRLERNSAQLKIYL